MSLMASSSSPLELQTYAAQSSTTPPTEANTANTAEDGLHRNENANPEFSLPPVDGGRDAWLFLAASFMIEALVWGFSFSFGIFQEYYSTHEPFAGQSNIALIGTCAMGVMYLMGPVDMLLLRMFPRHTRHAVVGGLVVMCLSLSLSSLSGTTSQLIATQGVLYALGGGLAYCPCVLHMDEWFVRRKGMAYGIMWSGTGLAGVLLPLLLEALLARLGWRGALRVWAAVLFVATAPLAVFIKPRVPVTIGATAPSSSSSPSSPSDPRTHPSPQQPWKNFGFLLDRSFLLHQLGNVVEAMGFFLPGIYLPSYARTALGAGTLPAALTVLVLNVASVFGCVAMGTLVDRFHVTTCILVSTVGATAACLVLWGLAANLATLYLFAAVYGLFAGSFTSTWPGIMREVGQRFNAPEEGGSAGGRWDGRRRNGSRRGGPVDPSMVFGCLAAGRGIGNVVSGPLSEALVAAGRAWEGHASWGYGSGYGSLIVFTGVTAMLGGASFVWRRVGWL